MPRVITENRGNISIAALTGVMVLIGSIVANIVFIQGQIDRSVYPLERRMERVENKIDHIQDQMGDIYREMSRRPAGAMRGAFAAE